MNPNLRCFRSMPRFLVLCIMHVSRIKGWVQDVIIGTLVLESFLLLVSFVLGWLYTKCHLKERREKAKEIARTFAAMI